MGRLYGYVRVSTGDQENSVLNQSERIQELAAKEGLPLEHVYVDEDVTARIPLKDRPQGRLLWDVLDPGDAVAFNRVDRVFRSVSDASQTVQIWQQRGIRAIIMDLGIDLATAAGRMFFHQLASFAEFEREMISQRTRDCLRYLHSHSRPVNNRPLGWIRDRPGKGAAFIPCEAERDLARRVLSWRESGLSLRAIWNMLWKERVAKPGKVWSENGRGIHYRLTDIAALAQAASSGFPVVSLRSWRGDRRGSGRSAHEMVT
jgi:DNA invertase Pin-like site-specific DNA recombinase